MSSGSLYLIPVTLGEDSDPALVLPPTVKPLINRCAEFIVEDERSARRFLKKAGLERPLQEVKLYPIGKHAETQDYTHYLYTALQGKDMGLLSEAGCPGVADPGADIVRLAHEKGIRVVPLVGPSSLLLALMASGMNGQSFCFHGYLPIDKQERRQKLKELERIAKQKKQTQLFIETPFRNDQLLDEVLATCEPGTLLCIACDLTLETELVKTKTVAAWKKEKPDLRKRPAVFLIG